MNHTCIKKVLDINYYYQLWKSKKSRHKEML